MPIDLTDHEQNIVNHLTFCDPNNLEPWPSIVRAGLARPTDDRNRFFCVYARVVAAQYAMFMEVLDGLKEEPDDDFPLPPDPAQWPTLAVHQLTLMTRELLKLSDLDGYSAETFMAMVQRELRCHAGLED